MLLTADFLLCSYMVEEIRQFSETSFIKVLLPFMRVWIWFECIPQRFMCQKLDPQCSDMRDGGPLKRRGTEGENKVFGTLPSKAINAGFLEEVTFQSGLL